jgi:putative membrane protein
VEQRQSADVDPNLLWAAERTLLAWVRTAVAMMGFGFLLARITVSQGARGAVLAGTALAILGGVVNIVATVRYRTQIRHIRQGRDPGPDVVLPTAIGIGSAVIGVAVGVALFF